MYSPALNEKLSRSVIEEKIEGPYSLAICLEDTIADADVEKAIYQLRETLAAICIASHKKSFYLPKIFIRVRNPQQIVSIYELVQEYRAVWCGFVLPKYSLETAPEYNREILRANAIASEPIFVMPTLESGEILDLTKRAAVLKMIKEYIDELGELVLNIRVGGNDFSNIFSVRRHVDETIYDNLPIAELLGDILTVFSMDYVVSAPVWEYFGGDEDWKHGLQQEMKRDQLNGFVGKTVIHPNQIPVVNEMLKVQQRDYQDARTIVGWDDCGLQVGKSYGGDRMNEVKTHINWANKMIALAKIYGVNDGQKI